MSARVAGNQHNEERSPTDDYRTHPHWTEALLDEYTFTNPVWEPATGAGFMADVLESRGYDVRRTCISQGHDFFRYTSRWEGAIITNPPYRLLDRFVHHALSLAPQVAMLLPIGALGGQKRYKNLWNVRRPKLLLVVCARMPTGELRPDGKTPAVSQFNHVWAVWDGDQGSTELRWAL